MRQELWQERADRILPLLAEGLTFAEVARLAEVSPLTVARYSKRFEVSNDGRTTGRVGKVDRLIESIRESASEGKTRKETAERFDVSIATIAKYAREYSIAFVNPLAVKAAKSPR